jgi:hypothetical protein
MRVAPICLCFLCPVWPSARKNLAEKSEFTSIQHELARGTWLARGVIKFSHSSMNIAALKHVGEHLGVNPALTLERKN